MSLYSEYCLAHYGVKGMKWGVRRYENEDGTLTDEGKKHYADVLVANNKVKGGKIYSSEEYIDNQTDYMRSKARAIAKLYAKGDRLVEKFHKDCERNVFTTKDQKDEAARKVDAELDKLKAERTTLAKEWTNEFLGEYANLSATDCDGRTYNVGKHFATWVVDEAAKYEYTRMLGY